MSGGVAGNRVGCQPSCTIVGVSRLGLFSVSLRWLPLWLPDWLRTGTYMVQVRVTDEPKVPVLVAGHLTIT
jgi:hypothetical protein